MKNKCIKKLGALCVSAAVVIGSVGIPSAAFAQSGGSDIDAASETSSRVVAFKGAEGGGMYASGARGALDDGAQIEVYHVTNLNDSGEGSFRDAVSKPNRIVVFDVSGYVDLKSNVSISKGNITILGQTAPGDGICFRGDNIKVGSDNVILRYLRFRVGSQHEDGTVTPARDGLEITDNCQNVILDHCSVSWGTDENLSAYAVKDVTIQNSIIAEALNQSVHDKGEHSYAAIWGGVNLSVHHNLIASHKSRNPKIGTSETVAMTAGYTDSQTLVDIKNNVFYNWGDKAGYGTENGAKTYIQNNIYRPGPATPAGKRTRIFELSVGQKYQTNMLGSVYAVGNRIDVETSDPDYAAAQQVNADNWQDSLHTGVYVDIKFYDTADKTNMVIKTPDEQYQTYTAEYPITLDDTDAVFDKVIANAGATLPKRDKIDERIISNVVSRTAPTGSKDSVGLVDDPLDGVPAGQEADYDGRGYSVLTEEVRDASYDTDRDGIPDTWEDKMGLNKSNPLDGTNIGPDGLTWLEIYVEEAITNPQPDDVTVAVEEFGNIYNNSQAVELKANIGGEKSADVAKVEFYCNNTVVAVSETNQDGVWSAAVSNLPTGDNSIVAKAVKSDGSYILSAPVQLCIIGAEQAQGWNSVGGASYDGESYTLLKNSSLTQQVSGDFKLVTKIDNISNAVSGVKTGISGSGASGISFDVIKMYDDSFNQQICYSTSGDENEQIWTGAYPAEDYTLFEISRIGNSITLYAGTSLADLEDNAVASLTVSDDSLNIGAVVVGDSRTVSKLSMLKLSQEQTEPKIQLQPEIGQLRLSGDSVSVTVEPDSAKNVPVTEIWLYLDDAPIASQQVNITSKETISIPVTFTTSQRATLTAYCFDENLGKGSDFQTVAITQDPAPWQLSVVGEAPGDIPPYVTVTDDYTYKISGVGGSIGTGSYDNFAYLTQKFSGDMRMYYRSRMQSSKQFGVVFRSDLYADPLNPGGITYFFGGSVGSDGNLKYQLIRRAEGSNTAEVVADVTDKTGQSANLYFIAEKVGDTINIYQTENGATIYTTKTLLTSVKCEDLGDEYYMGFGVVADYDETNVPDAGWLGLENVKISESSGDTYIKSYEDGVVTINKGSGFPGGKLIVCGYNADGALVDELEADAVEDTTYIGQVAGESYKVFLWNNLEEMIPLCEAYDGTSKPVISKASEVISWNFDYGLDWLWQMQEKNVLRPTWTTGIGGNESGIMAIEPTDDYTGDRYIFREYNMSDAYVPQFSCDVLLTGDEPAMNVYFQTGESDKAYKITFADDGKIYSNGTAEMGQWDAADGWYSIAVSTDVDVAANTVAKLTVTKSDGTVLVDAKPMDISGSGEFRTQINTAKKTPVTKAVYFEPVSDASGKYYVDNVTVAVAEPSVKAEKSTSWYTFKGISAISGAFTVDGTTTSDGSELSGEQITVASGAELKTGSKTVDGISFTNRIRLNKNKAGALTVPVKTGANITVYAASANSSSTRSLFINGTEYSVLAGAAFKYTYDGAPGTIEIYAADGIDVYGVSVETVNVVQ